MFDYIIDFFLITNALLRLRSLLLPVTSLFFLVTHAFFLVTYAFFMDLFILARDANSRNLGTSRAAAVRLNVDVENFLLNR